MRAQMMTDISSIKQYQSGTNELLVKMREHIELRFSQLAAEQPKP